MPPNQVKQIAGRAGRFGTAHESGLVTTLSRRDQAYMQDCMGTTNAPVAAAGLLPSPDHIASVAQARPLLGLPEIIELYKGQARLGGGYFLCRFKDMERLSQMLERHPGISMRDRYQLACAPVKTSDPFVTASYQAFVAAFSQGRPMPLSLSVPTLKAKPEGVLELAESVYRSLDLYLWLGTHFPSHFLHVAEARKRRAQCGAVVDRALELICKVRREKKQRPESRPLGGQARQAGLDEIVQLLDTLDKSVIR